MKQQYCHSVFQRKRLPTHEVRIGDVALGGNNPIRVQSMTTTDTMDTDATVAQTLRMVQSGAEYVRITAPSIKEAQNLAEIKKKLREVGCQVPLIADIHFTPNAAELAARIVEKVRVNPGNYADKKKFDVIEYSDSAYQAELERIHDRFAPLVKICKEYGTAMRIGTNHGSLSDRILSRYGDTPLGMVESAMEFLRICEMYNYDQVVLSMKASNPQVMVQAYRLLSSKMLENGKLYPLHLGVTEAGEGEDGRVKSAQGIGALLMDGIGDTVRVSLTEEPEFESPVAQFLVNMFGALSDDNSFGAPEPNWLVTPFEFNRRASVDCLNLGSSQVPRVVADCSGAVLNRKHLEESGYLYEESLDKYNFADMSADFLFLGTQLPSFDLPGGLKPIVDAVVWKDLRNRERYFPIFKSVSAHKDASEVHPSLNFIHLELQDLETPFVTRDLTNCVLVLRADGIQAGHQWRWMIAKLMEMGIQAPVVLHSMLPTEFGFYDDKEVPESWRMTQDAKMQLFLAGITSSMVVDGLVDGIMFSSASQLTNRAAFGILQASRLRMTKTEYISCPSCGRTLFDLQETTQRIRKRTEHLKGVKIGIMGCIVNGPGEMADADYGYVGVGPDKIALYKGKEVVMKAVRTHEAVDKLIELIASDGRWIDPV